MTDETFLEIQNQMKELYNFYDYKIFNSKSE